MPLCTQIQPTEGKWAFAIEAILQRYAFIIAAGTNYTL